MKHIYLDYNATTPIDPEVQKDIVLSLKNDWANPSSLSNLGGNAKKAIDNARENVASCIGAANDDIIFTSGGTESSNMAIYSAVKISKDNGCTKPHIITSNVEHVATSKPLDEFKRSLDITITEVAVDNNGMLMVDDVISAIKPNTCLITVMLANNETGVIFPISDIACELRKINKEREKINLLKILFHSDAAQAIGKIKVDVNQLGVDYLTIVGHKFYGPRIGAVYVRGIGKTNKAYPVIYGGGQERGFRPGTENTPMIVGLGKAARLVNDNLDTYSDHMKKMRDYLQDKLRESWNDIVINCHTVPRLPNTSNISFRELPFSGFELLQYCKHTIASTTAACHSQNEPSGVLLASGVQRSDAITAIRFSTGRNTTKEEIDEAVIDINQAIKSRMKRK